MELKLRTGIRINNNWNWKIEGLGLEVCHLEKLNPKYYDLQKKWI